MYDNMGHQTLPIAANQLCLFQSSGPLETNFSITIDIADCGIGWFPLLLAHGNRSPAKC